MKLFKKFSSTLSLILASNLLNPVSTFAQGEWKGACVSDVGFSNGNVATIQGFECLFANILQVITGFAGLAFFIMFIYGGFQYLFSGNDEKKVMASSSTLTMAIVGLVGIIVSWLILSFIQNFTGANVTLFKVGNPN